MPEETKGPNPVSPTPGGEAPQAEPPSPPAQSTVAPTEKPAPATPAATPAAPVGDKPPAPAAAKPAAPAASAEKPAPAAAAAPKPATPAAKPAPKPEGPKPEPWDSELVRSLKSQYGSGIKEANTYLGQKYLVADRSIVYEVLLRMRDEQLYDYCVDVTAVHYPKREAQFDVIYILYSFHHNERVRVKTQIADGEHLRTVCDLWPTANWLEREVFDMFGIVFDGHPDLKRILMPDEWKGHPLRKDYPILQQDNEWVKINLGIESAQ